MTARKTPVKTVAKAPARRTAKTKPVLITTAHRGVFAGLVPANQDHTAETVTLNRCRMAIYWGTSKGVLELADTGPTGKSRISAPADGVGLRAVTMIADITPEAWAAWTR
jgi:hypothetical protein